ncbi:hypothetical protein PC114_g15981 [Phytophthora cactorum]|uniref:Uncharacterized protein n=1 Tax=Phytophthora cactorum TaxID=29920 RepID=A0A8T1BSG8_9STRA|nr:hypothetical protein PC114_g15981 [Phytophthora cactorum]KAG2905691.1 hypothetical protein PC115_g14535 [Phytophthora cactorum]KAG2968436.1 hypothetical protein PC120_g26821 [Phytophthora cactorum]KAG3069082.1 hypothetical protein PC122_g16698 [Phytophthora cactorum]KAG3145134.1 hypothetical protein PC128_g24266 [Phytophthora cactorum]
MMNNRTQQVQVQPLLRADTFGRVSRIDATSRRLPKAPAASVQVKVTKVHLLPNTARLVEERRRAPSAACR